MPQLCFETMQKAAATYIDVHECTYALLRNAVVLPKVHAEIKCLHSPAQRALALQMRGHVRALYQRTARGA